MFSLQNVPYSTIIERQIVCVPKLIFIYYPLQVTYYMFIKRTQKHSLRVINFKLNTDKLVDITGVSTASFKITIS